MARSLTHAESIVIKATPGEVYAVVSDVTRTGEWSPICRECWWEEGGGPRVGATFLGRNVLPGSEWTTRSQVTRATPGEAFAWSVGPGRVEWGYLMDRVDGGTRLTETWEFTPAGQEFFAKTYGAEAQARIAARTRNALEGIPATLAAIKWVVEGRPAAV